MENDTIAKRILSEWDRQELERYRRQEKERERKRQKRYELIGDIICWSSIAIFGAVVAETLRLAIR